LSSGLYSQNTSVYTTDHTETETCILSACDYYGTSTLISPETAITIYLCHFYQKSYIDLPYDPAIPLLGIYLNECDTGYSKSTCTPMFIAALFTIASYGNNQDAPLLTNGSRKCGTYTQWNFT
jgi:hypothetical protein